MTPMEMFQVDPLHASIALGPLGVYLLLLAILNASRRPFLTTGGQDTAALCVAVSGLVVIGPMELFWPDAADAYFSSLGIGWFVWVLLVALYMLCVTLFVLMSRPRLVIYNLTRQDLRNILEEIVPQLDAEARWAGDSVLLPNLGINLTMESRGLLRCVQLVSAGPRQDFGDWARLEAALSARLRDTRSLFNPGAIVQFFCAAAIFVLIGYLLVSHGQDVARTLLEMLRFAP